MQTALETINGAVFPSAGTGVVDTCLKAAALSDPPAPYELDSIWYDTYVVPFQNSLMLEYTRAMTMVVNAYHQKALLAAQANGMPAGDFSNLAPLICDGFYDGNDPLSTSKPSSYCDSADAFVSTHLSDLRKIVARGGTPYTDDLVAYYTGTGYLLPRSLGQYGSSTVGTYDARLANSSGYDGYTGTWEAAPVKVFKEILTGWKDLGGKDTTTAAYWLCHGTGDTSVAGDACSGLIGLDKAIIIFPETGKISKFNDKKYFCFMDGSIPRNKVEGQPFCSDDGFSVSSLFHSDGKCDSVSAYKQHTWTQSLASGDPTFYEMSVDNLGRWCLEPGYTNLTTKKPRWPAFNINQIVCAGGYPPTNPAGLPTKCGSDLTLWLNQIVPLAPVGTTTQPAPQALAPDSHAPVIEASLDFVADQPGSLGHFEVSYSCTDDVDNVVFLEARLNGVTVENGDTAELIPSSFEAFSYSTEGQPHIVWDKSFELTVTCSDKSGNTSEVTVPAVLQQANGTAS